MDREDNILSDAEHLYAEDLGGRDVTLTVKSISKEDVRGSGTGKSDRKYTFHFVETPKAYVPGVRVRRAICAACGTTDRNKIIGRKLILYPTTAPSFGDPNYPCIRFRRLADTHATPAPAEGGKSE